MDIIRKNKIIMNRGFTMIETFVAITILLISIVGPLSLIAKFYADNTYAKQQIAAAFLAQDGLESVNNIIWNNKLYYKEINVSGCVATTPNEWLGPDLKSCNNGCDVDPVTGKVKLSPAPGGRGYRLYKRMSGDNIGFYTSDNTTGDIATPYYRKIVVDNQPNDALPTSKKADMRAADVIVTVNWQYKGEWQKPVVVKNRVILHQCL